MNSSVELLWSDDRKIPSSRDGIEAEMEGGRRYGVSRTLLTNRPDLLKTHRTALTNYILENAGDEPVIFTTHNIDAILARSPRTVKQKLDALLRALAKRTEFQVRTLKFAHGQDEPEINRLMRAASLSELAELRSMLNHLGELRLIDYQENSSGLRIITTIPGLVHVEEQDAPSAESDSGFVAMWFNDAMAAAYQNGIAPAIEANGYQATRVDGREHNNKIDDEIISLIRRARFVVADFSCGEDGARGGVYFEAGFALGLGIPVIWSVRQDDLNRVHFDTRQFNHIVWSDPADLFAKLKNRIGGTIGVR